MSPASGRKKSRKTEAVRCSIYTRVSTPDQANGDFTSIDNQREGGEAYVVSQKHEGWVLNPNHYDDTGFSGGTLDRPDLNRLLTDIAAGKIQCVVVYKLDRLSRSLLDFARLVEVFDRHGVSLVSVTQPINTADSTGRLMLNILLSFAQFERETIADRTRDKISAARRKGKFTGGRPVLGYDLHPDGGKLVVNKNEAVQVREFFRLYKDLGALAPVAEMLNRRGWTTKSWTTKSGRLHEGGRFTKANVHALLTNPLYIGMVRHRGEVYQGEHRGIIRRSTWDQVQSLLAANGRNGGARAKNRYGFLLRGLVRCAACGTTYTPSTSRKGPKVYRDHVCANAMKNGYRKCPRPSINAQTLEALVVDQIRRVGEDPALIGETVRQVRGAKRALKESLRAEEKRLQGQRRKAQDEIRGLLSALANGQANGPSLSDRLGTLEAKVAKLDGRLAEIGDGIAALDQTTVNHADVARALSLFDPIWDVLFPPEQERIIHLLIDRIDYDGRKGKLTITFTPKGIKALSGEMDQPRDETAGS